MTQGVLPNQVIFKLNDDKTTYSVDCIYDSIKVNGEYTSMTIHSDKASFPTDTDLLISTRENEDVWFDVIIQDEEKENICVEVFIITKEDREISNMIDNAIGQYYDLEVIKNKGHLSVVDMGKSNLSSAKLDRYFNVKLTNINGLGVGQVHFITEDGHYLLIPWCYVISMTPSKEK